MPGLAMLAREHSARPTTYWLAWLRSLCRETAHLAKRAGRARKGRVAALLFQRVSDQHEDLLPFVEQDHQAEIADALVRVVGRDDELEALHLAKLGRVAEHLNEEQLGDIALTVLILLLLEARTDGSAL